MRKLTSAEIKRGQAITFRIPSDTPDYALKQLQRLKETEGRNFSSKVAQFVLSGVGNGPHQDKEFVTLPLPQRLSKAQRDWLKHAHSEALLGNILYELLENPMRTTALLSALNGGEIDVPEPSITPIRREAERELAVAEMPDIVIAPTVENVQENEPEQPEHPDVEEGLDDLLGDFLAQMNR
ncbi:hypothetical protein [Peribacillus asahii]|uniref:hypothetical protein n=1 Tax=Peribacillus asahii TaxID=228899 RepID=UPI0020792286|nr:hypothetical protein [Peribacillus asahii]USK70234.1 hypothetical protein LIS76_22575 [Peribacillus asahii]